jgi:hypothetical protein
MAGSFATAATSLSMRWSDRLGAAQQRQHAIGREQRGFGSVPSQRVGSITDRMPVALEEAHKIHKGFVLPAETVSVSARCHLRGRDSILGLRHQRHRPLAFAT